MDDKIEKLGNNLGKGKGKGKETIKFDNYNTQGQSLLKRSKPIVYSHKKKENIQLNNTLMDVNTGFNEWESKYKELRKKVKRQKQIIKEVDQIQNEKKRTLWQKFLEERDQIKIKRKLQNLSFRFALPPYPFKTKLPVFDNQESERVKSRAYTANARMGIYDKQKTFMTQLIPDNINYSKFNFTKAKSKKNLGEKSNANLPQLKDSKLVDFGYKNTPFFALMEQESMKCQKIKDECRLLVKRECALKSRPKTTDHSIKNIVERAINKLNKKCLKQKTSVNSLENGFNFFNYRIKYAKDALKM